MVNANDQSLDRDRVRVQNVLEAVLFSTRAQFNTLLFLCPLLHFFACDFWVLMPGLHSHHHRHILD